MRFLGLLSLGAVLAVPGACSLHSLERLDRCADAPDSSTCPAAQTAGGGPGAGAGAGSSGGGLGGVGAGGKLGEGGAGTGGTAGTAGESDTEAGAGGSGALPSLVLLYADHSSTDKEPSSASRAIRPNFSIENRGDEAVPLRELTIRYYYTLEAASTQTFLCDFVRKDAVVNDCAGVTATFGNRSAQQAKNYAEIGFQPPDGVDWELSALGGTSGVLQLRFYNGNFAPQDQTNDYSFDPSKVDVPEEWTHVTLYRNGQLVYGIEPS